LLRSQRGWRRGRHENVHRETDEFRHQWEQTPGIAFRGANFESKVLPFGPAEFTQTLPEGLKALGGNRLAE
jgi:hypothetical protein